MKLEFVRKLKKVKSKTSLFVSISYSSSSFLSSSLNSKSTDRLPFIDASRRG